MGRIALSLKETSGVPDLTSVYCALQSVDILNALPTTANPSNGATGVTGSSPHMMYYGTQPSMNDFYVFESYCTVHTDDDHVLSTSRNVTASSCVYQCSAGHFHSKGHVVWDFKNRRKFIVPEISIQIWNYFQMCNSHAKHFSDLLIFVQAPVDYQLNDTCATTAKSSSMDEIDPSSEAFPNVQIMLDDDEKSRLAAELFLNTKAGKITARQNEATQQNAHEQRTEGTTYVLSLQYSGAQRLV